MVVLHRVNTAVPHQDSMAVLLPDSMAVLHQANMGDLPQASTEDLRHLGITEARLLMATLLMARDHLHRAGTQGRDTGGKLSGTASHMGGVEGVDQRVEK